MKSKIKPTTSGLKGKKLNHYAMQLSYRSVNFHIDVHLELCGCLSGHSQTSISCNKSVYASFIQICQLTYGRPFGTLCTTIITFKDFRKLSYGRQSEPLLTSIITLVGFPLEHSWTSVRFHTDVHLLWTSIRTLRDVCQPTYGHQSGPMQTSIRTFMDIRQTSIGRPSGPLVGVHQNMNRILLAFKRESIRTLIDDRQLLYGHLKEHLLTSDSVLYTNPSHHSWTSVILYTDVNQIINARLSALYGRPSKHS